MIRYFRRASKDFKDMDSCLTTECMDDADWVEVEAMMAKLGYVEDKTDEQWGSWTISIQERTLRIKG